MDGTQVMDAATLAPLLSQKCDHVVGFEKELCNIGVSTAHGEFWRPGRARITACRANVEMSSLEELHALLLLESHGKVRDAVAEVNKSGFAPEHVEESSCAG